MSVPGEADEYVSARRSLLDALDALAPHRDAIVLVGAQAIYLRYGEAALALPAFTTDGDLAIDPAFLAAAPDLSASMEGAGFRLKPDDVGIWQAGEDGPTIDLLVPATAGGAGRRGARLGPHGNRAAKKVPGLEGALVDRDQMTIVAFEHSDSRVISIAVAGPAAMLVAKAYKIADRLEHDRRIAAKDAYDVYRVLQAVETAELRRRFSIILADKLAAPIGQHGLALLSELFGNAEAHGSTMAGEAVVTIGDSEAVALAASLLVAELLGDRSWLAS